MVPVFPSHSPPLGRWQDFPRNPLLSPEHIYFCLVCGHFLFSNDRLIYNNAIINLCHSHRWQWPGHVPQHHRVKHGEPAQFAALMAPWRHFKHCSTKYFLLTRINVLYFAQWFLSICKCSEFITVIVACLLSTCASLIWGDLCVYCLWQDFLSVYVLSYCRYHTHTCFMNPPGIHIFCFPQPYWPEKIKIFQFEFLSSKV